VGAFGLLSSSDYYISEMQSFNQALNLTCDREKFIIFAVFGDSSTK